MSYGEDYPGRLGVPKHAGRKTVDGDEDDVRAVGCPGTPGGCEPQEQRQMRLECFQFHGSRTLTPVKRTAFVLRVTKVRP